MKRPRILSAVFAGALALGPALPTPAAALPAPPDEIPFPPITEWLDEQFAAFIDVERICVYVFEDKPPVCVGIDSDPSNLIDPPR